MNNSTNESHVIQKVVSLPGSTATVNNSVSINAERRLLSGAELARYIGMSRKFVSKHTEAGRLPGVVRCGRYLRYDRYIIDRRLAAGNLLLEKDETV